MKRTPASNKSLRPSPLKSSLPIYISATKLRAQFVSVLSHLEASRATVILCRYNKPAAILRGGIGSDGQPVIQFIPIESDRAKVILRAARNSA